MNKLKVYLLILFYWITAIGTVAYIALSNVTGFIALAKIDVAALQNPLTTYWTSSYQIMEALLMGLLFGLLFIAVNEISERMHVGKFSFGKVILIKSLMYLGGFFLSGIIVYLIMSQFDFFPKAAFNELMEVKPAFSVVAFSFLFLIFQILLLNFVLQTVTKLGSNNLFNFLSGKYQQPVVEDRIFLFMDLKSSTTYAEKLGNIKYSQLIKDCFDDINLLVGKYKAEIYQYVGDEVVLTWKTEKVLKTHEFIGIFYAFGRALEHRGAYYKRKYDMVPEFKAGIHGGQVTVAEIGNIKRDIAYHGDVLNTASRIQSICNEYEAQLLISGELLARTGLLNGYKSQSIGEIQLKGKLNRVGVCALSE